MDEVESYCQCQIEECAHFHQPQRPPCKCIRLISRSTKFVERILACTDAIVEVLGICGIHECKAKAASDVIVFNFLHFDAKADPVSDITKKKVLKEDLLHDLGRKCRMNRAEAYLAYIIIRKAFKAFYCNQNPDTYNLDAIDEIQWMLAAQSSAEMYANSEDMSENKRKKLENRIKCAYCSFIRKAQEAREKVKRGCACCFCSRCKTLSSSGSKLQTRELPMENKDTYEFKKRLIQEGRIHAQTNRDYCGLELLRWQTLSKSGNCKCGGCPCSCMVPPFCACPPKSCTCKFVALPEKDSFVWTTDFS